MEMSAAVPILRIFSEELAHRFYVDYLGFSVDWTHRFGDDFPLYMQVRRSGLTLHLTEHHGDATPGSAIFVTMHGIDAFHAELHAKDYRYLKPGIESLPWGRVLEAIDPFGNRIRFCEPPAEAGA